ncbi:MAG: bis(5'-nucleosyl)-tetraphosphatase (symmetrical) YqeK [Clostridia bacterium]|nr:bis(5'-nucleosyl)-tetraphosphatase (symmetrical) YqeK [Clostridia bacterium]
MTYTQQQIAALRDEVSARLGDKRLAHTLRVAEEAKRLAELYLPIDTDLVEVAALLHDVTKELSDGEQYALCRAFGIDTAEAEGSPQILHAWTGAGVTRRDFPEFAHPAVMQAVYRHTTGTPDMTLMDEIIFVADYIEPGKLHEDCVRTRAWFWGASREVLQSPMHLHRAVKIILENTVRFLEARGYPIQEQTLSAYTWICQITQDTNETDTQ